MTRHPPWSGFERLDVLWPLFVGGGLVFLSEKVLGVSVHNTFWIVPFLLPGVLWALYLLVRYVSICLRHFRGQTDNKSS